jgi:hypothetical protein
VVVQQMGGIWVVSPIRGRLLRLCLCKQRGSSYRRYTLRTLYALVTVRPWSA